MGGNIIEFEALKIMRKGIQQGIHQGEKNGRMKMCCEFVQNGLVEPDLAAGYIGQETSAFLEGMRQAGYIVPGVGAWRRGPGREDAPPLWVLTENPWRGVRVVEARV